MSIGLQKVLNDFFVYWFVDVFFFKQKTAYEMRISDWSSDVVLFRSSRPGLRRHLLSEIRTQGRSGHFRFPQHPDEDAVSGEKRRCPGAAHLVQSSDRQFRRACEEPVAALDRRFEAGMGAAL